ncbi:ABC transporter permease [Paraburkholderia sp. J12]|uniref:ABC transporter permease n=1 Tax=Paraburkholderia sp. J12 TaxID=2805432 RepID=UPI002ABD5081|nr:ABC transporter permease [Paraburkholderia sp. J12]
MNSNVFFGELLIGLINGAFYALLSLGLAIIFGLLNIINFAHGALYMLGAFAAWLLAQYLGIGYWPSLIVAPLIVAIVGMALERTLIKRTYKLDHMFGLLLTMGIAAVLEGLFVNVFGAVGRPYGIPQPFRGSLSLGFMFLPVYRGWVIVVSAVVCIATWFVVERTKLGAYLRAATENPNLVRAFGVNVPRLVTLVYGFGAALAAFAGVIAAPVLQVNPLMGGNLIITVFAVVVIGGMGSIVGSIVTGFGVGLIEGLTKAIWPAGSNVVIFVIMAIVLMVRPEGLFGKATAIGSSGPSSEETQPVHFGEPNEYLIPIVILGVLLVIAPFFVYPVFLMKVLCYALFAMSFNFLMGFVGIGSFGHAMFLGGAGYATAYAAKVWGLPPEISILIGVACATLLGVATGYLALKRQKIYFAMVTLAFAEMVYFFCVQARFTGGEDGIQPVPRGKLFALLGLGNNLTLYFVVATVFFLGFLAVFRAIHSPFGHVLRAIRENEPRAISLGYNTARVKLLAFTLSAALAGLAGALKVIVFQIASLPDVYHSTSGDVILMALVGGIGTIFGPIAGALAIVGMQDYLAPMGQWVEVLQGLVFVVCVLLFRQGIGGYASRLLRRPL